VVEFDQDGEVVAGQAGDHVQLPERAVEVELLGHQFAGQRGEIVVLAAVESVQVDAAAQPGQPFGAVASWLPRVTP
jgi:hypothetical protein